MSSIHQKSGGARFLHAVLSGSRQGAAGFFKNWIKFPIHYAASLEVEATPTISFSEFFQMDADVPISLAAESFQRHRWNVRIDEEICIGLAITCLRARRIFEIGTFNGGTTKHMAENAGPDAQVFTLDLPPKEFDDAQDPGNFSGSQVGEKFRGTAAEQRITQLLGNSTTFDYSPYERSMDFVFVDGAHDYVHGLSDSRNALRLVRPGGVIFWHDYVPYWSGLIHGIREATQNYPLKRIDGTTLAALRVEK